MSYKESMARIQACGIQAWGKAGKEKGEYLKHGTAQEEILTIVK